MRENRNIYLIIPLIFLLSGCITEFIPQTKEDLNEMLVVEGLITDQYGADTIKLSKSLPLGLKSEATPVNGCFVSVLDNQGYSFVFREIGGGKYVSDPSQFRGITGRTYTLRITTNALMGNYRYQSYPMEMKTVPPIDSIYYEKVTLEEGDKWIQARDGCQIYLNTHDPTDNCKFYRWEFDETWEFHIPYTVQNNICWATDKSDKINIKNTTSLVEDRITKFAFNFIPNTTDKLREKYSILVHQYSITEDEYNYWEKTLKFTEQVGGLYDIIPSEIPGNVYCVNDPNIKVLGFFSVSSHSSKRFFIKDNFAGQANYYTPDACVADTIFGSGYIPNLNSSVWVLVDNFMPPYKVITYLRGCADCTMRGTNKEPDFWRSSK